jgi:signal transduction histidine kinase
MADTEAQLRRQDAFSRVFLERKDEVVARWLRSIADDSGASALERRTALELAAQVSLLIDVLVAEIGENPIAAPAPRRVELDERESFLAILGHDLQNPLNAIVMSATALTHRSLPEKDRALVFGVARAARRMGRMIDDLLDFSRAGMTTEGIPLVRRPCDASDICEQVLEEARLANPGRPIVFAPRESVVGTWDRDRLAQLISNLLSNAIAYSPAGSPVTVGLSASPDRATLTVHNDGDPIPEGSFPRLFEPFRRGDRDRSSGRGLGLGLFIVEQIVAGHGGAISVTSSESEGTTFTVLLPVDRHQGSPS